MNKRTTAKVVLVIIIVFMAVLTTYFVYPFTQPRVIVGAAVAKDEESHSVSLRLLTGDRLNRVHAGQLFNYTMEEDDFYWVQIGDIMVVRVKGSRISLMSIRSSLPETPISLHHEFCGSGDFGGMCGVSLVPVMLPRTFTVGRTWVDDVWTDHTHYFGLLMHPQDKIRFSFNATEPLHFQLVFSNHIPPDVHAIANEAEYYG